MGSPAAGTRPKGEARAAGLVRRQKLTKLKSLLKLGKVYCDCVAGWDRGLRLCRLFFFHSVDLCVGGKKKAPEGVYLICLPMAGETINGIPIFKKIETLTFLSIVSLFYFSIFL